MDPGLVVRGPATAAFIVVLRALEGLQVEPEVLSYEGPFGVGYLVASFRVRGVGPGWACWRHK